MKVKESSFVNFFVISNYCVSDTEEYSKKDLKTVHFRYL